MHPMNSLLARICSLLRDERGQTLTEYSLILVFVAIACVIALGFLALAISGAIEDMANAFP